MNFKSYDIQYYELLAEIFNHGDTMTNKRTGVPTMRIPHGIFQIDLEKEFPILHSKKVRWQTAVKEILWIMQKQSNNIKDLDAHIWDDWADKDGSIGAAYGFQVSSPVMVGDKLYDDQVRYVLESLREDPSNRRCVIDLWNVCDLNQMKLVPCCYTSSWNIIGGRLNCLLVQRSADYLVGVPFNTTQYAVLTHLFANDLGVKPGILTHVMSDVHVYQYLSHIDAAKEIIKFYQEEFDSTDSKYLSKLSVYPPKKFFDAKLEDIQVINYSYANDYKLDVAV